MSYESRRGLLSRRLIEARKRTGMTQYEAADALGIGDSTIASFEVAGLVPNVLVAAAAAKLYGISLLWLIGEKVKKEGGEAEK